MQFVKNRYQAVMSPQQHGHGHSHGQSVNNSSGLNKNEASERAKNNWAKLRDHVKMMNIKANFMVKFLDEEEELLRQMGSKNGKPTEGFTSRNKTQLVQKKGACKS